MVVFSKKMQSAGFYYSHTAEPNLAFRNFNTWLGDPAHALETREIVQYIQAHKLLSLTSAAGEYLKENLWLLAEKYPDFISSVRGRGTYMAFDVKTAELRDKLIHALCRKAGLNLGGSGTRSVRLRPMLIFGKSHADTFLSGLESVIKALSP